MRSWALAACLAVLVFASPGCGDGEDDGLEKYPVRGTVLVNGEPAGLMAVTFNKTDGGAGNEARPVAVTDAKGRYVLSTNADKDGAVVGEYAVTFYWSSENGPSAYDRLGGRFNDPKASKYRVKVEARENDVEPLKLEVDAKKLRPPRKPALPQ